MSTKRNTRRDFLKAMGVGAASAVIHGCGPFSKESIAGSAKGKGKPNIVLVLTDDVGWTDTSVRMMASRADSRSKVYQTPSLERMAKKGMVFSNAYASSPVCTPTRCSIQFGKTTARLRQTTVHDVLAEIRGIDCKDEVSLPQMIKSADRGYVTAHFGKSGFPPRPPEDAGYDVTDGATNNFHGDWRALDDKRPLPADDPKRIFSLTRRANKFMQQQVEAGRPFYMQVSHYAVHVNLFALKETIAKYEKLLGGKAGAKYAALIENLDTGIGMLLDKIDELGIADNTYVIFISDNGAGRNRPLRGGKASVWEGGIRVPMLVCGPGVKRGCYCDIPAVAWDIFPTVSDLIGNQKPLPDGIDGGSLRDVFEKGNKGRVKRGTEALVFHYPWYAGTPMSAIRLGDYKLVKNLNTDQIRLFNVVEDIEESKDLSGSMPGKAGQLNKVLTDYLEEVDAEKIEDMRAARKAELMRYWGSDKKEIEQLQEKIAKTADEKERLTLQQRIADRQRNIEVHKAGLEILEKTRHIKW